MPRAARPLTLAIRKMLDESNGTITHKEARPKLAKLKFPIADENNEVAFGKERNNFDVTKYNWAKIRESGRPSTSRKPSTSKNTKARTAAKHKPKRLGRPARKAGFDVSILATVEKLGGVAAVHARIKELQAEVVSLENVAEEFEALQKRMSAAA